MLNIWCESISQWPDAEGEASAMQKKESLEATEKN